MASAGLLKPIIEFIEFDLNFNKWLYYVEFTKLQNQI